MLPSYIINSETLLQRFMGDQQTARDMLECFRDSIPRLLTTLKNDVTVSDLDAIFATIKKVSRLAICSSAVTVQECALQMEHAVIMEDLASVQEIAPLLEQMSNEAIGAINADYSLFSGNPVDMG